MTEHCEHGYRKGRHCPQCKPSSKRARRRTTSVYESRSLVTVADDEESWHPIGSIDPQKGIANVDYPKASGWVSLPEFLWRR